jgi:hypothetical protein
VVTNLRLPGQYDERLLGSLGLQGPYYNWNRWFLPGMGRYLELDPLDLRGFGDARGRYAPMSTEWFTYGQATPMRLADPAGLTTYWCTKPLDAISGSEVPPQFCASMSFGGWSPANPLGHWYLCVDDGADKPRCGGKTSENGAPVGRGTKSADTFNAQCCRPLQSNGSCR